MESTGLDAAARRACPATVRNAMAKAAAPAAETAEPFFGPVLGVKEAVQEKAVQGPGKNDLFPSPLQLPERRT